MHEADWIVLNLVASLLDSTRNVTSGPSDPRVMSATSVFLMPLSHLEPFLAADTKLSPVLMLVFLSLISATLP